MRVCDVDRSTQDVRRVTVAYGENDNPGAYPDPETGGDADLCADCRVAVTEHGLVAGLEARLDRVKHPRAQRNRDA